MDRAEREGAAVLTCFVVDVRAFANVFPACLAGSAAFRAGALRTDTVRLVGCLFACLACGADDPLIFCAMGRCLPLFAGAAATKVAPLYIRMMDSRVGPSFERTMPSPS